MTPKPNLGPVLAATDFSAPARHALDRAAFVARETGAPLNLIHVLPGEALRELRHWLGAGHAMEEHLEVSAREQLYQLAEHVKAIGHLEVQTAYKVGPVLDDILAEARAQDAGLLVVGSRGVGFMRRLVLGSTSERLLRRTALPVLMVRQIPHEGYRRALVAVDFSPWSAHAIALARRVAPRARLLLFNAYQVPFHEKLHFAGVDNVTIDRYRRKARAEATQRVHALAASSGLRPTDWEPRVVEGDASQRIVEEEQESDCDLVVLGKHGQSATEDLLLGSVSKHVLAEGSSDVLVSTARDA